MAQSGNAVAEHSCQFQSKALDENHSSVFTSPDGKNGEEKSAVVDDAIGKERRDPSLFNLRLGELLDPDPDNNILAVGLTGMLAWASLQVLSQLFFVSLEILVTVRKYSFIAAILLFILITLL